MKRSGPWFEVGTAIVLIAIGAGIMLKDSHERESVANDIASMPPRVHNLAVFDAAVKQLEANYYDPNYFATPGWRQLRGKWRNEAEGVAPELLYVNVLDRLAGDFPQSHLGFVAPRMRAKKPAPSARPETAEHKQRIERNTALALMGPGFVARQIRRPKGNPYVVGDVMRGSPGERAGVAPGWVLLVDDIDVSADRALYTADFLEVGPDVSRRIEKTGELYLEELNSGVESEFAQQMNVYIAAHTVKVEFELEELPATDDFETRELPGGITYVRFDVFESMKIVEKTLEAIDDAGPGGVILDLRRNPGGLQTHLQRVAGALLGEGVDLGTTRTVNSTATMYTLRFTDHYEGPLVVLIGPYTASAAEITAAAVQDHKRGKIIGRTTAGAVVPGQYFDLPDGGKMMIPVSDFVRSNGKRIESNGVEPDIWVLPSLEEVRAGRDPALERAVQELSR
jgi:carboxyl-terminal processing protease